MIFNYNCTYSIPHYSYDRKKTFDFTLGAPGVITGVDMALMDMCEGEMRRITIPSILAYGEGGISE